MSQANIYEQHMLDLINAERAKAGESPLVFNGELNVAAENHSQWMIDTDTFEHTGVNGSSPGDRMTDAGYDFEGSWTWGENISYRSTGQPDGYMDEIDKMHEGLMNSAGHRANILNPDFKEIGIGLEVGEYHGFEAAFITQDFAKSDANNTPDPVPVPDPQPIPPIPDDGGGKPKPTPEPGTPPVPNPVPKPKPNPEPTPDARGDTFIINHIGHYIINGFDPKHDHFQFTVVDNLDQLKNAITHVERNHVDFGNSASIEIVGVNIHDITAEMITFS